MSMALVYLAAFAPEGGEPVGAFGEKYPVDLNSALQPDSALQQDTTDAVRELTRTAASFRVLADYLQQHPEALIRGKTGDSK